MFIPANFEHVVVVVVVEQFSIVKRSVITDASKDQGVGFFGGMEPYVFDMEWVTNDEGNFDAMHALYKQKVSERRARDVRSPGSTPGHKEANSRTNRSQRSNRQRR